MRVTVDPKLCTGCGICEVVCPEVFRLDGGGKKPFAVVRSETVPEEAVNFCRDARDCCKPQAILVVEDPSVATRPRVGVA